MPYVERSKEELIRAYESLLSLHPAPDEPIRCNGRQLTSTFREIVSAIKKGEPLAIKVFIDTLKLRARMKNQDPIDFIANYFNALYRNSSPQK